jgi:hypothetical protein
MAYNKSNATTFNQLIQQGLSANEASVESGVSTDAASYGIGTNDNTSAIIPGAGGIVAELGLTQVSYTQPSIAVDAQSSLKNASVPVIDPRIIVSTTILPTVSTVSQPFPFGDNTTGVELVAIQQAQFDAAAEAEAIQQADAFIRLEQALANAKAQPFPFGDNTTGIDPERAAQLAALANAKSESIAQPFPFVNNTTGVNPESGLTSNPEPVGAASFAELTAIQQALADDAEQFGLTSNPEPVGAASFAEQAALQQALADDAEQFGLTPNPEPVGAASFAEQAAIQQALADDAELFGATAANSRALVGTQLAQRGAVLDAQRKLVNNGDWRVRLSLAAGADYLYKASPPGILGPLATTGGVIFPYMPKIDVSYKADYEPYSLTHSNYKGYFYKSSYTDAVNLTATFTAQDTSEANYLLAVIHFFRSVTKMFYGQDAQRGAPPPLVYLTGLGEYQFAAHPCVVSSFQYNLPNDVDYIRAGSPNINGTNLITRRNRQDLPTNPITGAVKRLENLFSSQGINKGAVPSTEAPRLLVVNSPTYVPTKIDCVISLLPMQTRAQVSQVFSLKSFANGDLIKGGFW